VVAYRRFGRPCCLRLQGRDGGTKVRLMACTQRWWYISGHKRFSSLILFLATVGGFCSSERFRTTVFLVGEWCFVSQKLGNIQRTWN